MVLQKYDARELPVCIRNDGDKSVSGRVLSYEEALEEIGFGKVQLSVLIVTFFLQANTLTETMGISFIIPGAQCDLNLTASDKGLLSGMAFLGVLMTSHFFGYMADTKGRKAVIFWSLLGSTLSTYASVFIRNFKIFLLARFLCGAFVAGYSSILYAYLGEFNSNKYRPSMLTWVTTSVGIASSLMPLIAFWIMSYEWSFEIYNGYLFRPWRLLLIFYSIPGVVAFFWLLKLPESPRFLLAANRSDEALAVVQWIFHTNRAKADNDDLNIARLESEASTNSVKNLTGIKDVFMSIVNQTLPLFKPPHVVYFLTCCTLHFGLFTIAGGFAMFMPDILNKLAIERAKTGADFRICDVFHVQSKSADQNLTSSAESEICNDKVDLNIYLQTIAFGVVYTILFVILSLIIRQNRRIAILATNYGTAALAGFVLTFVASNFAIIAIIGIFILFSGVNVPVVNGVIVDTFPTNLRSMAISCSMLFGRLGTTLSSNVLGYTFENYCQASILALAGVCVVCSSISLILQRAK